MAERASLDIVRDTEVLRSQVATWRRAGLRIGFVPTMGALHEGHLSLVRRAAESSDRVVASVFVNPTQFGPQEDFESYPRDPARDAELLAGAGCSLLFLPEVETIYPPGHGTFVEVEEPSRGYEGTERPGHFRGVATVVCQLLNLVQPDLAVFGEKDAQQLAVVRRLVRDLHLPVEIVGAPIVRESDGLAMSSRNVYLSEEQRTAARSLSQALGVAKELIEEGERRADVVCRRAQEVLDAEPLGDVDYLACVDAESFHPLEMLEGRCVVVLAVRFGATRLLDNIHIDLRADRTCHDSDSGSTLQQTSRAGSPEGAEPVALNTRGL